MSLNKNCGCNKPCGCGDRVLESAPACTSTPEECGNPQKCSETFSSDCIIFKGETIANLNILQGDSLTTVIQKLVLAITNPGCAYPDSPCGGVVGLLTTSITSSKIKLVWNAVTTADNYQVEYRKTTSPTWLLNPAVTELKDTIGDLEAATDYYVRVKTVCGDQACYSVTLLITTKS